MSEGGGGGGGAVGLPGAAARAGGGGGRCGWVDLPAAVVQPLPAVASVPQRASGSLSSPPD